MFLKVKQLRSGRWGENPPCPQPLRQNPVLIKRTKNLFGLKLAKIGQNWHDVKLGGMCTQCTLYSSSVLIFCCFLSAYCSYKGMYFCYI